MPKKFDDDTKTKAIRLVTEHSEDYASEYEAIKTVAGRLGMNPETPAQVAPPGRGRHWPRRGDHDRFGSGDPGTEAQERRAGEDHRDPQGGNVFLRAGERPATSVICAFIAERKARFGVAPICRALSAHGAKIAPRTYYAWASRAPSKRALWDITITEILAGYYEPDEHGKRKPESLYGSLKMWARLRREGIEVARCTVERLMQVNRWQGVRRVAKVRTTVPDPTADRAPDLVDRAGPEPAARRGLHLPAAGDRGVCLHRVRDRRLRRPDRRLGVLDLKGD